MVECLFQTGNTDALAIGDSITSGSVGGSPNKKRGVSVALEDGASPSGKKKAGVSIGFGGGSDGTSTSGGQEFGITFAPSRQDFKVEVGGVIGR